MIRKKDVCIAEMGFCSTYFFAILMVVDLIVVILKCRMVLDELSPSCSTKFFDVLPGRGKGAHGKGATGLLGRQIACRFVVVRWNSQI